MKEKIGIICDKNNLKIQNELLKCFKTTIKNFEFIDVNANHNASSILSNADKAIKMLYDKKIDRLVAIDDYGIEAFMYISKFPNIVVAEISDEHSAHMTMEHNNATVLSFGSKITTEEQIKNIIISYCKSKYEGTRHKVRIDMLNELSQGGK